MLAASAGCCATGSLAALPLPFCIASQTRLDEAGMSKSFTPSGASASSTALMTAGGEPIAPASPQPLVPSGLWVQGVQTVSSLNCGNSVSYTHLTLPTKA